LLVMLLKKRSSLEELISRSRSCSFRTEILAEQDQRFEARSGQSRCTSQSCPRLISITCKIAILSIFKSRSNIFLFPAYSGRQLESSHLLHGCGTPRVFCVATNDGDVAGHDFFYKVIPLFLEREADHLGKEVSRLRGSSHAYTFDFLDQPLVFDFSFFVGPFDYFGDLAMLCSDDLLVCGLRSRGRRLDKPSSARLILGELPSFFFCSLRAVLARAMTWLFFLLLLKV